MKPGKPFVVYYRVSTRKQDLGIEAQRAIVEAFVDREGGRIIAEFEERETGTRKKFRPEFAAAVAETKAEKATLVIAKLDRLARDVETTARLMNSGIDFICCDMPTANRFTIHVMAALAEQEARQISQRTKDALAVRISQGKKLGFANPLKADGASVAGRIGAASNKQAADAFAARLLPMIRDFQKAGCTTLAGLAARLNGYDIPTARGGKWHARTVANLLARTGE
jgi:DNA invertase Pin-like site-specific DNA recombinase